MLFVWLLQQAFYFFYFLRRTVLDLRTVEEIMFVIKQFLSVPRQST